MNPMSAPGLIIETANLRLVPCEAIHFEAILRDKQELGRLLEITVPDSWPEFPDAMPHAYQYLKAHPHSLGWMTYLFIHAQDRMLIGEGGYKGLPDQEGVVEIGYAIIPEYRRRGFAYEAAQGLTARAFSNPQVRAVQAHTLPQGAASIRVLEKLGMRLVGTVRDPDEGDVLQWRMEKQNCPG